ncbi:MAG: hypothetical protein J1E02_05240 [Coprobacter sp.]|nr:hypothetical protein [Coprobacter sp.]
MKTRIHRQITALCLILLATACGKDEFTPYDTPFIRIMQAEVSSVTVADNGTVVGEYLVALSSRPLTAPLEVNFRVDTGDGLTAGVDYEMLTAGTKLVFPVGVYDMYIRVRWKPNPIDPAKNNTMTITLESTSNPEVVIGLPGPAHNQSQMVITKVKGS